MDEQHPTGEETGLKVVEGGAGDDAELTEQEDAADDVELGVGPAPGVDQQFIPPKITMLRPGGIQIEKFPDGSAQIELLISPFEVIGFSMPAEAVKAVVSKLSGGIEIARSIPRMDVPRGRG